ncbi:MAG: MarR family winged helix-turn-helix transcriptional regulator [Acidobacteriota bacterium]
MTQLAVMRAIERHPGVPLRQIADELSMDRTSLYRAIATLRTVGFVEAMSGVDARSSKASLTASGRAEMERAGPLWDAIQSDVVETFGRARWGRLVEDLASLIEIADDTIKPRGGSSRGPKNRR